MCNSRGKVEELACLLFLRVIVSQAGARRAFPPPPLPNYYIVCSIYSPPPDSCGNKVFPPVVEKVTRRIKGALCVSVKVIYPKYYKKSNESCTIAVVGQIGPPGQ